MAKALINKGITRGQLEESEAAVAVYSEVVERFGESDTPELQKQVAMALVNKGCRLGQLGETETEIAVYDEVVERFGDSDAPELQEQVAKALINKGVTWGQLGEVESEIAVYSEVVERFGDSDAPELREQVAIALVYKGVTWEGFGEIDMAITTCDEVVERFGDSDVLEIQVRVALALLKKCGLQIDLDLTEESLHTCDELERKFGALIGNDGLAFGWRAGWMRTKALLVQKECSAAMKAFRSVYAAFDPGNITMTREMLRRVFDLIATGVPEHDLVEILSSDKKKSDTLAPFVVALRQRMGETIRAPAEVIEIAKDIITRIEEKKDAGDTSPTGATT